MMSNIRECKDGQIVFAGGAVAGGQAHSFMVAADSLTGIPTHSRAIQNYVNTDFFCGITYIATAETELAASGPYEAHKGLSTIVGRLRTLNLTWNWQARIGSTSGSDFVSVVSMRISFVDLGFYGVFTRNDDRELVLLKFSNTAAVILFAATIDILKFLRDAKQLRLQHNLVDI